MLVYFSIMLVGVLVLGISLIMGGDAEFHADAPDLGGVDGVDVAGTDLGGSFDFGSWLSVKVLAAFCVGFGALGLVGRSLQWPVGGQIALASGAGILMAIAARAITRLFTKNETSSHVTEESLAGKTGMVTAAILEGRMGEVAVGGIHRPARARDGKEIPQGVQVRVVAIGPTLIVERAD
jgi:membrane protein implicated in regulation of membrane protease activity